MPEWAEFVAAPNWKYFGMWAGPGGHGKSWIAPLNKYRHRSNMLSGVSAPTAVSANRRLFPEMRDDPFLR
eukprot:8235860-Pyramimonas_sp.AAC.2